MSLSYLHWIFPLVSVSAVGYCLSLLSDIITYLYHIGVGCLYYRRCRLLPLMPAIAAVSAIAADVAIIAAVAIIADV
jgi:hypothetical protein